MTITLKKELVPILIEYICTQLQVCICFNSMAEVAYFDLL